MNDIKNYENFTKIELVNKGWSSDKKYYIETKGNEKLLLRVSDVKEHYRKKIEFDMMVQVYALGVPMSKPIDFGICDGGKSVYSLFTWCDGEDAETVLPMMTETQQYILGVKSGEILKNIQSIPAPMEQEEWGSRFSRKTIIKIETYRNCGVKVDGDDKIINYLEDNMSLLEGREQCFQHGDYHVGNMIISKDNSLNIIDFNRLDFGDPWEEFNRIVWSAATSPHFATGQLDGYFGGKPPIEFFRLLAYYIGSNAVSAVYWALSFGEQEMVISKRQIKDILTWFDDMKNPVPTWYIDNFYIQYINEIPYKLKSPFDMSFIEKYGQVFKVYDDQDSGNICLGVQNGDAKYFIKFAGAPTQRYDGTPKDAIERLKATVPIYRDLVHENLIKFITSEEIGGGFAIVFEWTDGECMGKMYPQSRQKFMQMPYSTKLSIFSDILAFHQHAISKNYVAIDFYDGSIMYDFTAKKTMLCDIDFYAPMPYTNPMGRMWGSSRFMSPEEYVLGETIDEITNVYLMGATAFALFGGEQDRSVDKWNVSEELYNVALKAVSDDRNERFHSIAEFANVWNKIVVKL